MGHRIGLKVFVVLLALGGLVAPNRAGGPTLSPFTEEASARGITYFGFPNFAYGYGSAFADLDNDGDPDIVLLGGPGGQVGVFENDGTGNFVDRSLHNGIPLSASISGVAAGDYDGDGDLDLYLSHWFVPDVLVRNDGGFQFTDVTAAAGLGADVGAGTGCAWADFDGDGWLDLFVANRSGSVEGNPGVDPTTPNRLYKNLGDGTFADVAVAVGITSGDRLTYQGVWFDYQGDGDADLYVSNDKCINGKTNRLWVNQGGTFVEDSEMTSAGVCIDSMGVAVGDFDGNGYQDLYPTNTVEGNPLLLGQFDGRFIEFGIPAGVASFVNGWGAFFFDYDNDGWQELYVANQFAPNKLFDHDGSWPCASMGAVLDVDDAGDGYGTSYADIDLDGDLDVLVSNTASPALLYINHEGEKRNFARFNVVGQGQNHFGVGTVVTLRTGGAPMIREVTAGGSYKSQHEMPLHFGLDNNSVIGQTEVLWPGGATRILSGLGVNQTWTLYPPDALGDADRDRDVDRLDFIRFVACHGPSGPGNLVPGCEMMDADGDSDVDDADYAAFLGRYQGPLNDCNGSGATDLDDLLDGTSLDVDENGVPDECDAVAVGAGTVPNGPAGLIVTRLAGDAIRLDWSATCGTENDYQVYEGDLGSVGSHVPVTCSSAGATTWTMTPESGSRYYLVAPTNSARQGSLGLDGSGAERSAGSAACLPQELSTCP